MMKNSQPVYLIDSMIYVFRSYFSLPDRYHTKTGRPVNAVYGYTLFLLKLLEEIQNKQHQPTYMAAAFDKSLGSCFRNEIYSNYKISRPPADDDLKFQINACEQITEYLGIPTFSSPRYEADDLLGTCASILRHEQRHICILSRDKDLAQLIVSERDYVWEYSKNIIMDASFIKTKFAVEPCQLVDLLALAGDSVDDIPGVPGIGLKTAAALLNHFYSVDNLLNNLQDIGNLKIRGAAKLPEKIRENQQLLLISRQLATIKQDIPINQSVSDLVWSNPDSASVENFFSSMSFGQAIRQRFERIMAAA